MADEKKSNLVNDTISKINVSQIKRESIKNLKKHRRVSKALKAWTYPLIFDKLDRYCQEHGVRILEIKPTYTSQRCSNCGWVRKKNRNGKEFKCTKCGFTFNADLNAAINISLDLRPINFKERRAKINKTGFYWLESCQELIVPGAQENKKIKLLLTIHGKDDLDTLF